MNERATLGRLVVNRPGFGFVTCNNFQQFGLDGIRQQNEQQ
jgi:hypothetical protein